MFVIAVVVVHGCSSRRESPLVFMTPWQEGEWCPIVEYFNSNAPEEVRKKAKTLAAKRGWITKVRWRHDSWGWIFFNV